MDCIENRSRAKSMEKPKNHKSRSGCITCKKKRLKCDESKPCCLNCSKKGIQCGGYTTNFKWKSFGEVSVRQTKPTDITNAAITTAFNNNMKRSYSMPENTVFEEAIQQATMSIAGTTSEELAKKAELMAMGKNPDNTEVLTKKRKLLSEQNATSPSLSTLVRAFTDFESFNIPSPSNLELSPLNYNKIQEFITQQDNESAIADDDVPSPDLSMKRSLSVDSISSTSLPQYRKDLLHFSNSLYSQLSNPSSPGSRGYSIGNFTINSPNLSYNTPSSPSSEHLKALTTLQKNSFSTSDFEKIFNAYSYTCAIMSIKNGPNENPWKTLLWPLALNNSVLFKAIASMSLFHIARGDESLRKLGMSYMKQSMNELAEGLVNNSIRNEVALATCIVLAVTDGFEKHTSSGLAHLKGAKSILKKLDKSSLEENSKLYEFLINTFIYHDVLARMSNSQNSRFIDEITKPSAGALSNIECKSMEDTQFETTSVNNLISSFLSEFNLISKDVDIDSDSIIDPLLGCARGLFLIIGQVATFIAKVRNMNKLSLGVISKAVDLKSEIENWKPDVNIKRAILEDPLCDLSSCIATAESYRFSTLLYLQQAVPEISSQSSNDLAEKVLMLLASIPTTSRTCNLHIFPLLIASCEMNELEDRKWILDRWDLLREKMWIGNIDRTVDIVKEVWKRKDLKGEKKQKNQDDDWDLFQGRIDALTGSKSRTTEGINSWTHWSTVMKEWNWEIIFG